jgi:hypothetical protein
MMDSLSMFKRGLLPPLPVPLPLQLGFFFQKVFFGNGEYHAKRVAHPFGFGVAGNLWGGLWLHVDAFLFRLPIFLIERLSIFSNIPYSQH